MEKYTTSDFEKDFPTDDACLEWIVKTRWPEGITCGTCQRITPHYKLQNRPCYSCEMCGSQTYPMVGTIFQDTHLPLRKWFYAFTQMAVTRCGISARQLSRNIGVTPNTALRIWKQIRSILTDDGNVLLGEVEVDETYIGGKHPGKRGRGAAGKTIVAGVVERGGRVRAKVVPNVRASTLLPNIQANVLPDATVYSDDLSSYNGLARMGYNHRIIPHTLGVYVLGRDIHTNTIDGFWSQLKRSIDGTYHHVTPKYLQGYVDEYAFRYSHRKDVTPMFWTMLERVIEQAS